MLQKERAEKRDEQLCESSEKKKKRTKRRSIVLQKELAFLSRLQKHLVEQRAKIQQKYDEAKFLKEGIDRRARFLSSMLEKYFSKDDFDDYEYFIRMKSTIVLEKKQIEEQLVFLEKEFSSSTPKSSTMNHFQTVVTSA